jgi:1,4-dihydroxy-2-naphthoate octaprenyltransferase
MSTLKVDSVPSSQQSSSSRQARLHLTRLDPWSVAKASFMFGITLAGVIMVATIALWLILSAAGVFEAITSIFNDAAGNDNGGINFLSLGRLVGLSMLVSAAEIVLLTVLSSIFAVLYNLSVGFTGGIEVTFSDRG